MDTFDELRMRQLIDVGRGLVTELDPQAVLDRVLEAAREITGARYAALGILDHDRTGLARLLTQGIDAETHRAIGGLPLGRGVLGVLIEDPHALRLTDVSTHPQSYGFPPGHPVMRTLLGVPILIRGEAWGNLYLADKEDGPFTVADEEAVVILAEWAAIAIVNARLYETSERRRTELERAVRGLEATRDVSLAIGANLGLARILDLIAKRARALIDAGSVAIMLREGGELIAVTRSGSPLDVGVLSPEHGPGGAVTDAPEAAHDLQVPMTHGGEIIGLLVAAAGGGHAGSFSEDDEQLLKIFAATAANAVAMAHSVEAERLRSSTAIADAERRRFARELHDQTLQGLGGLRMMLASAVRREDADATHAALREVMHEMDREIDKLRSFITHLRPAALDELGLRPALETLLTRHSDDGLRIVADLDLPDPQETDVRMDPELETAVYRIVQEGLTNVVEHARASTVRVGVRSAEDGVRIELEDDGVGFDAGTASGGFGLTGMRERAYLLSGSLEIESGAAGTLVKVQLPAPLG
ncbi:MAG TPA: GAF domain-containing sensor histidine kinase [Solirubrobacteraceae bacterium]|jgi:signal transduction histidine kinase|nr:GAF domain-containing sensor histidine kinase [Solirubrobacteraceae bacterium]